MVVKSTNPNSAIYILRIFKNRTASPRFHFPVSEKKNNHGTHPTRLCVQMLSPAPYSGNLQPLVVSMDNSVSWELNSSNYHLAHAFHDEKHTSVYQMLLLESKCVIPGILY